MENDTVEQQIFKSSKGNYEFAKNLYAILSKNDGNVFFSPISLYTTLSLLSQGSENETLKAIEDVLRITRDDAKDEYKDFLQSLEESEHLRLHMANKIYFKQSYKLRETFQEIARENYKSEIELVNFIDNVKAAKLINEWVKEKTNDKIQEIIDENDLNEDTRMVLLNAIYFKADWSKPFKETKKLTFHINSSKSINDVDMMYQCQRFRYGVSDELNSQIIELPYYSIEAQLYIILPHDIDGITLLEEKFSTFDIFEFRQNMYVNEVKLTLPKFKIETTMKLNDTLKKIGLNRLYKDAEFGGIFDCNEPLIVTDVIQKTYLNVNESGTEAAAATMKRTIKPRCLIRNKKVFTADHPFIMILIKKNIDTVLFCGRLSNL